MTYSEKLKDPRWQKKRLERLSKDDFTCQNCGDNVNTLHVHHKSYRKGVNPWDYQIHKLITLCFECHEIEERVIDKKKQLFLRLKEKYPNIIVNCPACGNNDAKMYHIDKILCTLCSCEIYFEEMEKYIK